MAPPGLFPIFLFLFPFYFSVFRFVSNLLQIWFKHNSNKSLNPSNILHSVLSQ
jgi:hypothetical protein